QRALVRLAFGAGSPSQSRAIARIGTSHCPADPCGSSTSRQFVLKVRLPLVPSAFPFSTLATIYKARGGATRGGEAEGIRSCGVFWQCGARWPPSSDRPQCLPKGHPLLGVHADHVLSLGKDRLPREYEPTIQTASRRRCRHRRSRPSSTDR